MVLGSIMESLITASLKRFRRPGQLCLNCIESPKNAHVGCQLQAIEQKL